MVWLDEMMTVYTNSQSKKVDFYDCMFLNFNIIHPLCLQLYLG